MHVVLTILLPPQFVDRFSGRVFAGLSKRPKTIPWTPIDRGDFDILESIVSDDRAHIYKKTRRRAGRISFNS